MTTQFNQKHLHQEDQSEKLPNHQLWIHALNGVKIIIWRKTYDGLLLPTMTYDSHMNKCKTCAVP